MDPLLQVGLDDPVSRNVDEDEDEFALEGAQKWQAPTWKWEDQGPVSKPSMLLIGLAGVGAEYVKLCQAQLDTPLVSRGQAVLLDPSVGDDEEDVHIASVTLTLYSTATSSDVVLGIADQPVPADAASLWARGILGTLQPIEVVVLEALGEEAWTDVSGESEDMEVYTLRCLQSSQARNKYPKPGCPYLAAPNMASGAAAALLARGELDNTSTSAFLVLLGRTTVTAAGMKAYEQGIVGQFTPLMDGPIPLREQQMEVYRDAASAYNKAHDIRSNPLYL